MMTDDPTDLKARIEALERRLSNTSGGEQRRANSDRGGSGEDLPLRLKLERLIPGMGDLLSVVDEKGRLLKGDNLDRFKKSPDTLALEKKIETLERLLEEVKRNLPQAAADGTVTVAGGVISSTAKGGGISGNTMILSVCNTDSGLEDVTFLVQ